MAKAFDIFRLLGISSKINYLMLTSKDLKRFKKLHQKKHRLLEQLFIAEGVKVVEEFIAEGFRPINVFADHTYEEKYRPPFTEWRVNKWSN